MNGISDGDLKRWWAQAMDVSSLSAAERQALLEETLPTVLMELYRVRRREAKRRGALTLIADLGLALRRGGTAGIQDAVRTARLALEEQRD